MALGILKYPIPTFYLLIIYRSHFLGSKRGKYHRYQRRKYNDISTHNIIPVGCWI